jgi:hypothetical protein
MSARDDATELLNAFSDYSPPPADARVTKIGIVQSVVGGVCKLLFDGETVTGGKLYPCLSTYSATVGDRVIVLPVGSSTSWIVLGAIN